MRQGKREVREMEKKVKKKQLERGIKKKKKNKAR